MHPKKLHKKVNGRLEKWLTERRESSPSISLPRNYYSECITNLKIKCQMNNPINREVNELDAVFKRSSNVKNLHTCPSLSCEFLKNHKPESIHLDRISMTDQRTNSTQV